MSNTNNSLEMRLLDTFPYPMMILNEKRELKYANSAASEIFDIRAIGRDLSLSIRIPELLEATSLAIKEKKHSEIEISLSTPVYRVLRANIISNVNLIEFFNASIMISFLDITSQIFSDKVRQDFIANLSHELRSPLASLIGFIETLSGPARDDENARLKFLKLMKGETYRMIRMVDDLLSLAKIEGRESIKPNDQINIIQLLNTNQELFLARAEKNLIDFNMKQLTEIPNITGDQDELMKVFQNLIDNAIKYGDKNSPVTIEVFMVTHIPDLGGKGVAISIFNKGEDIAPEHIPRLTERFYRIDKSRSRELGGTGLGLAIVKHILNRHRGILKIESKKGYGSTFIVYLPIKNSH
tara:strand:+ start:246 stop:1310 length:1065 start_codon:yes stop_codon:yes gene_type:complete